MRIERVLAPNPGPYTGAGTNTWLLDGDGAVAVIDPGPVDTGHADSIVARLAGRPVAAVIVTHTHEDHAPLANPLGRDLDAPVMGHRPGPRFEPDQRLAHDDRVQVGGLGLRVVHTPGHSDDHLCFLAGRVLFTGDHIKGGSSVMVEDMGAYMGSLRRVARLEVDRLHPGHGEIIENPTEVIDWYLAHRRQRETEIAESIGRGATTLDAIVADVYRDVDAALHPLAARSVMAHLTKLADEGAIRLTGTEIEKPTQ